MIEQRNKKITMETRKKIKCEIYRDKKKPPIRRQFLQDTL